MKKYILIICTITCILNVAIAQGNYVAINYSVAFPLAQLEAYIGSVSGRGINFEYYSTTTPNVGLSASIGLNVFYESLNYDTYTEGTVSLSGKQYRYTNSFPILIGADYLFLPDATIIPYAGLDIGTIYVLRNTDMGLYRSKKDAWQFCLKPEAGVVFKLQPGLGFKLAAKYYQAFESSDLGSQSYLAIDVGILFGSLH